MHFTQPQVTQILEEVVKDEEGFNTIMKICLEALMKSERFIHNQTQCDVSNGYRLRKTFGSKRMLELQVPRTRNGMFYPVILSLLKDQESEAKNIAFHLYKSGLTTTQVGEVFDEIYGKHYSSSQVSRMFDIAREEVEQWLNRPIDSYYPIVMIDATFIPTRRIDSVSKEAYYTILGVRADRTREVLGVYNFPTESASAWESIFDSLKERGLNRVDLFVSDSLSGIENSIFRSFSQSEVQLCVIHLSRNLVKHVKPKDKAEFMDDFWDVFRKDDRNDSKAVAKDRLELFITRWRGLYPKVENRLRGERIEYYFTYLGYDYRMRSKIYTTNWIERLNRDFKRTTRMRGALPSPEATLLLLGGVAMGMKNYLRKVPLLDYERYKFDWED